MCLWLGGLRRGMCMMDGCIYIHTYTPIPITTQPKFSKRNPQPTWKQPRLENPHPNPQPHHPLPPPHHPLSHRTHPPPNHYPTQPRRGLHLPQYQVTRNLEQDVRDEEDEERDVVIGAPHVQVGGHVLDGGVPDVGAVEEGEEEEGCEGGEEVGV